MSKWVQGDGGPAIIIQSSIIAQWQGADNFENSLMNGGTIETDYDIICRCDDGVSVIEKYGRDMLVLSDSEWATVIQPLNSEIVVFIQIFGTDKTLDELMTDCIHSTPELILNFEVKDNFLRLLVGADTGDGEIYGYSDVACAPGLKQCEVYFSEEAQIVFMRGI